MDITTVIPFGRYRLIGIIASGGMARLALALMTGTDGFKRVVAVKQVHPHFAQSRECMEMFVNEARLAARLDHPNIVRIFELGQIQDQHFISMEYLPGEDVAHIIQRSREVRQWIPVPLAVTIIQQVAEALQYAHELEDEEGRRLGIVHRDVSPSNVIVTYHGSTKLADFGIAKATAIAGDVATRAGAFKGKFAYAAPEQLLGQIVDARTDVFALGIVLWEMLTLRRLFKREHEAATIHAVEKADVPPLQSIRPRVPAQLESIVAKALAKRPEDRFQSAQEMSDALEEMLKRLGSRASTKHLRTWITKLFGEPRAEIKRAIAQGRGLEKASPENTQVLITSQQAQILGIQPIPNPAGSSTSSSLVSDLQEDRLRSVTQQTALAPRSSGEKQAASAPTEDERAQALLRESASFDAPRAAWSTELRAARTQSQPEESAAFFSEPGSSSWNSFSVPDFTLRLGSDRRKELRRFGLLAGLLVGLLVFGIALAIVKLRGDKPDRVVERGRGQLAVSSDPVAAAIVLDGAPTGLMTPAVIRDLPTEKPVKVRLEKSSFAPLEVEIQLNADRRIDRIFRLKALSMVRFEVPLGTTLSVDGARVNTNLPAPLTQGKHEIQLFKDGRTVESRTITVEGAEETVRLGH